MQASETESSEKGGQEWDARSESLDATALSAFCCSAVLATGAGEGSSSSRRRGVSVSSSSIGTSAASASSASGASPTIVAFSSTSVLAAAATGFSEAEGSIEAVGEAAGTLRRYLRLRASSSSRESLMLPE
jgi:hypothetical protein